MLQETPQQTEVNRYTVTHTAAAVAARIDRVACTCSQDTLASASQLTNRCAGVEECLSVSTETQSTSKMPRANLTERCKMCWQNWQWLATHDYCGICYGQVTDL